MSGKSSIPPGSRRDDGPPQILVVDDELVGLRALGRRLEQAGYGVTLASSSSAALEHAKARRHTAVITDISMPDIDGLDLLRALREADARLPVILFTGAPALETAVRALELGAFRYLSKTCSQQELLGALSGAVEARWGTSAADADEQRSALEAHFASALGSLWMAYQPIVRAEDGQVFGHEALMRSKEPALPHPGAVLEAAEELGSMVELGRKIRDLVGARVAASPDGGNVFVNLHARDLGDPTLLDPSSPLSQVASRIILEITERASLDTIHDVRGRIDALRALGFRIALDDLGAGYSGLSAIALLEPDVVKLDMSLVRDVHVTPKKQKLVRALTTMALDLEMEVVGEGVECPEERDVLVELGCGLLQGFYFGRPQAEYLVRSKPGTG